MRDYREEALELHKRYQGKLETTSKIPVESVEDLSLVYSPGVAEPCKEIHEDEQRMYDYTMKGNTVAVITNGSAVLGLGDIGAKASLPVMEGKCMLFKSFANVNAFPLCIEANDTNNFVDIVKSVQAPFGGINLEDIKAPECFEIEEKLKKELDIPVFHDDQHGTAIVTVAGLMNALKLLNKSFSTIKVVINGAGSAGVAIVDLLLEFKVNNIIVCDSKGAIYEGREERMNEAKKRVASITNGQRETGILDDVINNADVFIGVSAAGALKVNMIKKMNTDPIVFAMANPLPEIMPEEAKDAGVAVIGTGRSDFPNQVNNVLAFPGIFKGALAVHAKEINKEMKKAAVYAIASLIEDDELRADYVIPSPFDKRVAQSVADVVSEAAVKSYATEKIVNLSSIK
ncbi:NAD(P)-dependent malic enzyme [Halobacillus seohaensis]|uniref:NADP-dependent malic enzyme n=1 Tax=Halobacillus seohaensis TaxID=447421 RepID=A0ABW2EPS1_9BACI